MNEAALIYLVRHGQTEMNLAGRMQGQGDAPLTEAGIELAVRTAKRLAKNIGDLNSVIYCSPLGRACRTAEIIAKEFVGSPPPLNDDRLAEINLGDWDGLTIAEIDENWPAIRSSVPPGEWFFNAPNGESYESFRDRNAAFLHDLTKSDAKVKIAVTHGISGRVLRGLHANVPRGVMVNLPVPSEAFFALHENGRVEEIAI